MGTALVVGSSDGIGLALVRALVADDWTVIAVSRRKTAVDSPRVESVVLDVRDVDYRERLGEIAARHKALDLCVYCAGVGDSIELPLLEPERATFEVNLNGAVSTIEVVLPKMLEAGAGHIIGISSQADRLVNSDAPAYSASKAGLSSYLEGLALACRSKNVSVTNIRFGFVDTKMAKSEVRPFMISPEKAARLIFKAMRKKPIRMTHPLRMAALLWLVRVPIRFRLWFS